MNETTQEVIESGNKQELKLNLPALPEKPQEALLAIIQGATLAPNTDTNLIEKLWVMQQEAEDRDAEQAYWAAMPKLQADLPLIPKNGEIKFKRGTETVIQPYSKFEDVIEIIRPIMKKHGFSLTFKHKTLENKNIRTTGIVAHKKGHKEQDEFDAPPDQSGSKNAIQAVGSSRSYGKRYTTGSLLGLAFGGEDDDGTSADGDNDGNTYTEKPPEKMWPDDAYQKNFPKWKELIESCERSTGDMLTMIESKGKLSDQQKTKIRNIKPRGM